MVWLFLESIAFNLLYFRNGFLLNESCHVFTYSVAPYLPVLFFALTSLDTAAIS